MLAPDVLGSACILDLGTVPVTDGARLLISLITLEVDGYDDVKRLASDKAKLQRAVGAVAGGMLLAWRKGEPVYRPRDGRSFTGELVSHHSFVAAVDGMAALGLLYTMAHGNRPFDWEDGIFSFTGLAPRLWPTDRLLALATEQGITPGTVTDAFDLEFSLAPPVIPAYLIERRTVSDHSKGGKTALKAGTVLLTRRQDRTAQGLAAEVKEANTFAAEHQVQRCVPPRWRRVFGPSWLLGGRWYALGSSGRYQALSPAKRADIIIDGEPTAEVNVSASHLSIMLGLLGLPLPIGDPYAFDGLPRLVVKKWITATLGNGAEIVARWPQQALAEQPELAGFDAREVGAAIKERYPFLSSPTEAVAVPARLKELASVGKPQRLLTHRLMGIEADALTAAMDYLRRTRGVLALPVHNSLIVPAIYAQLTQKTIELAFKAGAGTTVRARVQVASTKIGG